MFPMRWCNTLVQCLVVRRNLVEESCDAAQLFIRKTRRWMSASVVETAELPKELRLLTNNDLDKVQF